MRADLVHHACREGCNAKGVTYLLVAFVRVTRPAVAVVAHLCRRYFELLRSLSAGIHLRIYRDAYDGKIRFVTQEQHKRGVRVLDLEVFSGDVFPVLILPSGL